MGSLSQHAMFARLAALGLALPPAPQPVGAYRAVVARQGIAFISGQFPMRDGGLAYSGRVGAELSEAEGIEAARLAALNVLAQIAAGPGGLAGFAGLLRLDGYVASAPDYLSQPRVLDGASQLFKTVLGDEPGAHARTAFAVPRLPLDAAVELVVTYAVHSQEK